MNGEDGKRRASSTRSKHEDRISQLPDDILIPIISHLKLKEATATSILTPRWRYLYNYTTRLHFPLFKPKYTSLDHDMEQNLIRSFPHFINTINRVLDLHKGLRIKEFRVRTYCLEGATINKWFEFALAKDVEILHIHMDYSTPIEFHYPLRENLNLMGETLICLKELSLLRIDVIDGEIQLLLDKFPLLESLSIAGAVSLRHASIVGHSSSKLKHLEISDVRDFGQLIKIDIDNFVSLVSLWFLELAFSLNIKNVPKLVEFRIHDSYCCTGARILSEMPSSIRHQLQTIKINTGPSCSEVYKYSVPLQLNGLKNIELQHRVTNKIDCFVPFYLIRACSSLEKLEIKFLCDIPSLIEVDEDIVLEYSSPNGCPNLKKMKISGFRGSSSELEFIFSILKIVNILEELVVETCDKDKKIRKLLRERAQRLFGLTASKVVVI